MIDSHCHLDGSYFGEERAAVLDRARQAGVTAFVCVGVGRGSGRRRGGGRHRRRGARRLRDGGRPPTRHGRGHRGALGDLRAAGARAPGGRRRRDRARLPLRARAARTFSRRPTGGRSRSRGRPGCRSCRTSATPTPTPPRSSTRRRPAWAGVIHCFTGGVAEARVYLDLGQHLSFSGIVTFKNAGNMREAAAFAPLDRILVETDAPYLAPVPHRGGRNEPAYIVETLKVAGRAARGRPGRARRGDERKHAQAVPSRRNRSAARVD